MRLRTMEVLAASAIAVCCLALAIHPTLRPGTADSSVTAAAPRTTAVAVNPAKARPRIEVVFVLDTTGSMSGLLEGAKQKIWAIANRLASGEPRPELRVGLVAYRDLHDDYVTRRFDFSADMDAVYAELLSYEAGGGGDTPEHVGRGLDEAINNMQWSGGQDALRLVFLVGDAPPHDDYQDARSTAELSALAGQRGIIINTVQCGVADDTEAAWRRIAAAAGGEFTRIAQDGGVVTVTTPFDDRLARLNGELAATVLNWGSADAKRAAQVKFGNRMSMSTSNAAEAASYSAKAARMNDEDLLGALDEGKALGDIPRDQLPDVLQGLSAAAQQRHIDDMRGERARVNAAIRAVSAERDAYLRDNERAAGADGFDGKVTDTLRRQAAAIGVAY